MGEYITKVKYLFRLHQKLWLCSKIWKQVSFKLFQIALKIELRFLNSSKRHFKIAKIQIRNNVANMLVMFLRLFGQIKIQNSEEEENTDYEKESMNY